MNRNQVNAVSVALMSLIEAHRDEYPVLANMDITKGSGRYDSGEFGGLAMKINITPKVTNEGQAKIAAQTTNQTVMQGLASPGTPVVCGIQKGTIIKSRRTKYLIQGVGGKFDGKQFTCSYAGTRLREEKETD